MTTLAIEKRSTRAWWSELWVQVLIAMALGIALGVVNPDLATSMQPLGDAFIKAIRMLIAPIIFCTVVHGIARMADMARVGRVALKSIIYFEVITTIALVIALVMVNLLAPGAGMDIDPSTINASAIEPYVKQTASVGVVPFLMNIIPGTFVGAFAEGNVLQVLFIAVACGFALVQLGERAAPLVNIIDIGAKMIFAVVNIVMWAAPIGAFGAIAFTVGRFGVGSLQSLAVLLLEFYAVCLLFVFIVFGTVARLCGVSLFRFLYYIRDEILIVAATTSSETVLPRLVQKLQDLGCEESVVGLVVPTGYSFYLDGTCLYLATVTVFLAQATNTDLSFGELMELLAVMLLTSKGAAGIAGAAFIVLAATLASMGTVPVASVALVLGIHRILSSAFTPVNALGNCVATIVVAKWDRAVDTAKLDAQVGVRAALIVKPRPAE